MTRGPDVWSWLFLVGYLLRIHFEGKWRSVPGDNTPMKARAFCYRDVLIDTCRSVCGSLEKILTQQRDPVAVLTEYVVTRTTLLAHRMDIVRLYLALGSDSNLDIESGLSKEIRKLRRRKRMLLARVFEKGAKSHLFRRFNCNHLAACLDAMSNASLFCWLDDPEQHPFEANIPVMIQIFLSGILERESSVAAGMKALSNRRRPLRSLLAGAIATSVINKQEQPLAAKMHTE